MEQTGTKHSRFHFVVLICLLWTFPAPCQVAGIPEIPSQFKLDMETAARLKPELMAQSVAANGRYAIGKSVFERLVQQAQSSSKLRFVWQLRIVEDGQMNAYASPDGTVYVENRLASIAGSRPGLWAAILSHEIAHVMRRDWARRYLYQQHLENGSGATIVLGDPGLPSASWTDASKASADMGKFCRQMEVDADRDGLMLMVKAGYHPDFVPALHHLVHAYGSEPRNVSLYAMHPCWEERDRELSGAYTDASIEFEHRWREWYASPGGNPPTLVFADAPRVRKTGSKEWEIQVPMRCQNLVGAVEVVLRGDSRASVVTRKEVPETDNDDLEVRQLTGCTSPRTTVVFNIAELASKRKAWSQWTDVYVVDAWGSVLARTELPKLPH